MSEHPTIETLFRQAPMTAATYFHEAISCIDKAFGEGYAQEHPELIGAFMQTAALDFLAGNLSTAIRESAELLESSIYASRS